MKNVKKRELLFFLGPALFFYCVFFVYPMFETIKLGFYETNKGVENFSGFSNFNTLLNDPFFSEIFWNALWNNLIFFLFHMFIQNPIGILIALLLVNLSFKAATFYRTAVMLPTMLSFVIVGFIWQLILSPTWGITGILYQLFGAGSDAPALLGEETTALVTLSLVSVWQFIGIPVLLIYAALISIDKDILEAVRLEKVGFFKAFFHVHLPMIWPTIALVSILTYVNNFNAFDLIYTVKGPLAGPNFSTDLLGTLFYRTFFGFQLQAGNINLGAAVATFMFLIILIGVAIYLFFVQRRILR